MPRRAVFLLATSLLLTACGGGGSSSTSSGGGMSATDREAVKALLPGLASTSIPSTLVALTSQSGNFHPTECEIYPSPTRPGKYSLFAYWKPRTIPHDTTPVYYAWFNATVGSDARDDVFHVSYSNARVSSAAIVEALREHLPSDEQSRGAAKCEMQLDGSLTLASGS